MIRLFVGTDPQQAPAERALEASVRANTSQPVDITWMRQGDPGWDWGGREAGWATPFTMFRWHIPKHCGYEGRALYMDCDQLALGDLAELWNWEIPEPIPCATPRRTDVIVWECSRAHRGTEIEVMDHAKRHAIRLPPEWDHCDQLRDDTKVLHFTRLRTQPWRPYPEKYPYNEEHQDPRAVELFWRYERGEA